MSDLKPCPFCGKDPNQMTSELSDRPCFYYECDNPKCGATEMGWHDTEQEAIDAWNTRPIEDALRKEISQLQADNRSFVEQMNEMALKPNQAIIERHEYDHDNPETYPPKRRSYLCETISGFVELFWNPIGQEWHIAIGMNHIYNHFQINAYYTWAYLPKGVTND